MREENIKTFNALMERKGEVRLRASGYSMYPYVYPSDICRFVPFPDQPSIGKVYLVASDSGILISHRLHRIHRDKHGLHYIFRGDANPFYDPPVLPRQVIGELIDLKRKGVHVTEDRRARQIWSWLSIHLKLLTLPFRVYTWWKRRITPYSMIEKRKDLWHLIYYRKEKSKR